MTIVKREKWKVDNYQEQKVMCYIIINKKTLNRHFFYEWNKINAEVKLKMINDVV